LRQQVKRPEQADPGEIGLLSADRLFS